MTLEAVIEFHVEENKKQRAEQAAQVSEFLGKEGRRLRTELKELEEKLAAFKQKNVEQLPDLKNMNLTFYEQTNEKLERTEERIRMLETQRMSLTSQLAITNPYKDLYTDTGKRVQTGAERLSVLTAEYLRASANYSPDHPDLVKLRTEIKSLESQIDNTNKASKFVQALELNRAKLSEARQKYSEDHPDVTSLEQSVAAIEKALRDTTYADARAYKEEAVAAPDNPTYVTLKTQLNTVTANLTAEGEKRQKLSEKQREYEARLTQTPEVERDYLELSRNYDNAKKKYREIIDKQSEAGLAQELELGSQAERFTLVQPAILPSLPDSPNRIGIALLGFVLAFGGGIGAVITKEYGDRSIQGSRGVLLAFNAPPLAVIPYIMTPEELALRRKRIQKAIIISVGVLLLLLVISLF